MGLRCSPMLCPCCAVLGACCAVLSACCAVLSVGSMPCHAVSCRYESAKKTGEYDAETRRRENAKHSLERYMHYFERWDAHNKAREKVRAGCLHVLLTCG